MALEYNLTRRNLRKFIKLKTKNLHLWAVVVAQLAEQSFPMPVVRGSNPVIGEIL